jgi:hypothetical protein
MALRRTTRKSSRKRRRPTTLRARVSTLWPSARRRRRIIRAFRKAPRAVQIAAVALLLVLLWATANGTYQVFRKPTELFFPVSSALSKMPAETWQQYESVFRAHATATITPEFLGALAQIEAAGNPVARTYWQWYATWDLFEIYRPASSAVGMYQITDANFAEARRYCIHNKAVVEDGPWHALSSCWFNSLYSRVVPTHAAEMTAAFLDRRVASILDRQRITNATLQQKQDLAALIHLCGAAAGSAYAQRGFRLAERQRCGAHDARSYLGRVSEMKSMFASYQKRRD